MISCTRLTARCSLAAETRRTFGRKTRSGRVFSLDRRQPAAHARLAHPFERCPHCVVVHAQTYIILFHRAEVIFSAYELHPRVYGRAIGSENGTRSPSAVSRVYFSVGKSSARRQKRYFAAGRRRRPILMISVYRGVCATYYRVHIFYFGRA